jgi:uncharacterized protein with HEPN domain
MKKRTENDPVRIKHILDATQTALGFVANRQRPDLDDVWHTLTQELPLLITELEKIPLFTEGKDRK